MLRLMQVLTLIGGLFLAAVGLFGGLIGAALGLSGLAGNQLAAVVGSLSFLALCTTLGLALAWHARQSLRGAAPALFRPRRAWPLILLFALVIPVGHLVTSSGLLPVVTLPLLHVAAAALPPLIVLALVGRSLSGVTHGRYVALQLSSGALLATTLAGIAEMVVVVGLIAVGVLVLSLQPEGLGLLQDWMQRLQDPNWFQDPSALAPLFRSPAVVAGVLLVMAGVAPAVEEAVKAIGVPMLAYRRPGPGQAFLWGLAGGAGFALAESLFNSLLGLESWGVSVLLRAPTAAVHCLNGGLMGLAWYALLARRKWLTAAGLYLLAVAIHGAWNAVSVGSSLVQLVGQGEDAGGVLAGAGGLVPLALLSGIFLAVCAGLVACTRYARRQADRVPAEATPLPAAADPDLAPTVLPAGSELQQGP